MERQGVHAYLLLIDPESLEILWANDNVEARVAERGGDSAVGMQVGDVIPFGDALGIPARLREVAATGKSCELHSKNFSVVGAQTRTSASMYRLPAGQLLVASEYTVDGVPS
ncbi:MAG: hypothetical protein P4L93_01105 [Coriobacteriia bacterium]|nr:hypothetical protein [Coriobacteriia bacterium]